MIYDIYMQIMSTLVWKILKNQFSRMQTSQASSSLTFATVVQSWRWGSGE